MLALTKFMKASILIVVLTVLSTSCMTKNTNTYLIDDGVAIFYPKEYNAQAHSPSLALMNEPTKKSDLNSDWNLKVEFSQTKGKSIAHINTGKASLYGTGEVTGNLLRNKTKINLWNTDNFVYQLDSGKRLYQSHPWVLGVRKDGSAFGVLADNTWRQELSLKNGITFTSESDPFRVIVIEKPSVEEVLKELAHLTGTIEMPPLWSLGFQQCRWSYYPHKRVTEIADTFRIKQIPCDVIWMDIHYMDQYKVFTFSEEYFPHPEATNEYLHQKDFKSVWMIDPGVKKETGYAVYDSGCEEKVWVQTADNKDFVGKVWPGDCVFPDFTNEKVAQWWGKLYKPFMATGIDGVWNDMNEPSVFENTAENEAVMNGLTDKTMPGDNKHMGGEWLPADSHLRYHNVYGMLMVKASREGILKAKPDKRPFVLTRSNYLGGQRYAATWTGDNASTWSHLKMSIPMSINLSLSGQPFNGPDIGGFADNATPKLFGHWMSIGVFFPFSRAHSINDSKAHEPWAFGKKIEDVCRTAINRRYRLLPYYYTLFHEAATSGLPVMRPVFMADAADTTLRKEQQAFMVGRDLIIVPKWAKRVRLPKGDWKVVSINGEESRRDSFQTDVLLRPGAIVPLCELAQSTEQYSTKEVTLMINLDENGAAQGEMYVDAGDGFGYKNGEFSILKYSAKTENGKIIISSLAEGDYFDKKSVLKVHLYGTDKIVHKTGAFGTDIVL